MSTKHAQGRLKVQHPHAGKRGYEIALEPGLEQVCQDVTAANARRLVACWNALDGVSTEYLEQYGLPDFAQKISDLRGQCDELLEALKSVLNWIDDNCETSGFDAVESQADAAIAKVEGGASPTPAKPAVEPRPVTPYTCPKCHALWLHWPSEQTGFGTDTLNCRSAEHCSYCEEGGVEQLERLEMVPASLKAPVRDPLESKHRPDAQWYEKKIMETMEDDFVIGPAPVREPSPHHQPSQRWEPVSPTAGMNIAQRILHVGGRNNAAGYIEFGSIQAVEALVRQVLRDLPPPPPAEPAVELNAWTPVAGGLPKSGVIVLACYRNRLGNLRRIRAEWVAAKTQQAEAAGEEECAEYDEATDTFYITQGWYERIDNWGDYSAVAVTEGDVTHWMPLPPAPDELPTAQPVVQHLPADDTEGGAA